MHKEKVIRYFGTQQQLASVLSISKSSVSQWGRVIPEKQALRIEKLTNGVLKYDPKLYIR
ncbi:Cro/CI family transcriptional regulator [Marinomonas aquiplantarum]|uniref:DNA-binding transcriptional regulator Cro n=1 Tax=Marinomonas aquiplantarum TaxID=491951 RepID=A0A366CVY0_9GAMM|nr:Cro/CI family transcriptional regulator [Marinomonas aquiplantarum]RBO79897.1 DNA-binding transcriptional regulator Cro [Marinomonas aquiplantarum]